MLASGRAASPMRTGATEHRGDGQRVAGSGQGDGDLHDVVRSARETKAKRPGAVTRSGPFDDVFERRSAWRHPGGAPRAPTTFIHTAAPPASGQTAAVGDAMCEKAMNFSATLRRGISPGNPCPTCANDKGVFTPQASAVVAPLRRSALSFQRRHSGARLRPELRVAAAGDRPGCGKKGFLRCLQHFAEQLEQPRARARSGWRR